MNARDDAKKEDTAAIMKLVEAETAAFYNKDYEAYANCWVREPYVRRMGWWTRGGVTDRRGWEEISHRLKQQMQDNPNPNRTAVEVRRENINLHVGTDMAWLTFDQYAPEAGEPDMDMPGLSREMRVLEKHRGEWKIAYHCYIHQTPERPPSAILRVDGNGSVSWMNSAAACELKAANILKLANGRLRAVDRSGDVRLKAAIQAAVAHDDKLDGVRAAIPVVLANAARDGTCVCWVLSEASGSGAIHISINDQAFAQDQLDAAAAAYGLSRSQLQIAEHIVAGTDLSRCAQQLGISVNTVRTHVQRMFEKTGAHSQPALVSALLRAEPPT